MLQRREQNFMIDTNKSFPKIQKKLIIFIQSTQK